MWRFAWAALLLLAGGCERNPDPAQAGFFSGVGNLATGTYDRRIDEKQQELSEAERLKQQLAARERAASAERQQTTWELIAWRKRIDGLDAEIRQLETRLAAARAERGAADARVIAAQRKLEQAKRARRDVPSQETPSPEAERRVAEQERAVAEALKLVSRPE